MQYKTYQQLNREDIERDKIAKQLERDDTILDLICSVCSVALVFSVALFIQP